jgi:hypothetical protein
VSGSYNVDFATAVRLASRGDGKELAKLLRGGMPLGAGEREMLAALVAGDLNPPPGKRSRTPLPMQRAAAVDYLVRVSRGEKGEAVANDLAKRERVDESTVKAWVRQLRQGLASAPDPVAVLVVLHGQPLPDPVAALRAINGQSG